VLPGGTLLDVDRLGIGEKARRLCSRGLLLSPQIRPVSPGNQIPHTVARIWFGGQVHDGDRLELHHFQVSMSGSARCSTFAERTPPAVGDGRSAQA
jgi:hypothetical protein